ncbi:hypothetical protein OB919_15725 [Halobacteria archaeon AArc-curdl1]|uniref:Uncharacterized protein n=1 Tax=Natronosalvus hydrolyticus TaxID=2979988 RepID=A0AAP2ZAM1_9EURY|nr:hypothetical protein [Halobacteria archaeon AArc-curdl1]
MRQDTYPTSQDIGLKEMGLAKQAYHRLRYRSILTEELTETLVEKEFHLPIFGAEEMQMIRQRPDYEELLFDFYANPEPVDLNIDHENLSYRIEGITVKENSGILYRLNRLLGRTEYSGRLHIKITTGETALPTGLTKHPDYEHLDARIEYYHNSTDATLYHEFRGLEEASQMLFEFNRILATCWSLPETIPEHLEEIPKWKTFNQFKEQMR